jgi:hypothetical protein
VGDLTRRRGGGARRIATYFDEKHIQKGNKLSTMHREADTYHTVMNHAAGRSAYASGRPSAGRSRLTGDDTTLRATC